MLVNRQHSVLLYNLLLLCFFKCSSSSYLCLRVELVVNIRLRLRGGILLVSAPPAPPTRSADPQPSSGLLFRDHEHQRHDASHRSSSHVARMLPPSVRRGRANLCGFDRKWSKTDRIGANSTIPQKRDAIRGMPAPIRTDCRFRAKIG